MVKNKKKDEKEDSGMSLDDAFGDDEGVGYAESKPRKIISEPKIAKAVERDERTIKASKPITKVKKGDKIKIDGKEYEVDAHYVLIDHGSTKEMAIELFDKADKDYQLRYFVDQVNESLEFYVLEEIIYNKKSFEKIEW